MSVSQQSIIAAMKKWVAQFIVKYNICPFAKAELQSDTIRYIVLDEQRIDPLLDAIETECQYLDQHPDVATTLVMVTGRFADFDCYLDLVDLTQQSVIDPKYQGVYQLASFHPQYVFADADENDPANFTNRAPYPTLHLIREESITKALSSFGSPEKIYQRNIDFARRKGAKKMAQWLAETYQD